MRAAASKSDKTNDLKIGWSFTPPRADTEMQARIEELADKCTEGRLTPEERDEYEALIPPALHIPIPP